MPLAQILHQQLREPGDPIDFGADERAEVDRYAKVIEELCKNRASNEYFRLSTESNCRFYLTLRVTFLQAGRA